MNSSKEVCLEKKSILLEKLFKFALTPSANGRAKKIINQGRFFCPGSWWPLFPGRKTGQFWSGPAEKGGLREVGDGALHPSLFFNVFGMVDVRLRADNCLFIWLFSN